MKKHLLPAVAGLVTVLVLSLLLGFFGASGWGISASCTGVGILVYTALQNKAANRSLTPADQRATAAVLASPVPPGMARLIVYRSNTFMKEGFMGRTLGIDLTLDGTSLTQLTNPRFTLIDIAPGAHTLGAGPGPKRSEQTITAAVGETLIFQLTLPKGSMGGVFGLLREPDNAQAMGKLAAIPMIMPDAASRV